MSDFAGHSRMGLRAFGWSLMVVLPIIFWRVEFEFIPLLKDLWRLPICLGLTWLGALFPDIDIKSKSQRLIFSIILVFMALLIIFHYYSWAAGVGFFSIMGVIFKHRGFLHTRWAAFLLPLPLLVIPLLITARLRLIGLEFYLAAVFGYISHLIADQTPNRRNSGPKIRKTKQSQENLV